MQKLWAKIMTDLKIVKQLVYEIQPPFSYSDFFSYLSDICYQLDIPTPVLMKTHIFSYAKFNFCKFTARDFVESINFDSLVIENIKT